MQRECIQTRHQGSTRRALKAFVTFTTQYGIDYKNPTQEQVMAFIQFIKPRMKSPTSIKNMIGSLSTAFKRMDIDSAVFVSFKVQAALRSIAFTGLFRQSNLAPHTERGFGPTRHLTLGDITRIPGGVQVRVKWSKTIQRAQDATSIAQPRIPGREFCPVTALDRMVLGVPATSHSASLFVTREGRVMPLSLLKKDWKQALTDLGLSTQRLSLHSLRSGGATAAWGTGQVLKLDLMRHGTWATSAWKGYVRPPPKSSSVMQAFKAMTK